VSVVREIEGDDRGRKDDGGRERKRGRGRRARRDRERKRERQRERERKRNSRAYLERVASGKTLSRQAPRRFAARETLLPSLSSSPVLRLALLHPNIRFFPPPPPTTPHLEPDPTRRLRRKARACTPSRAAAVSSFSVSPSPTSLPSAPTRGAELLSGSPSTSLSAALLGSRSSSSRTGKRERPPPLVHLGQPLAARAPRLIAPHFFARPWLAFRLYLFYRASPSRTLLEPRRNGANELLLSIPSLCSDSSAALTNLIVTLRSFLLM